MNNLGPFKQKLARVSRLRKDGDHDAALTEVEAMLKEWPGNGHLHVLWADLVQLQEDPKHTLDEAKQALQQAVELDRSSPASAIELGSFIDNVEDNPQAASTTYAEGIALARQLLIEGLIGQTKALLQLGQRGGALRGLSEVLQLLQFETSSGRTKFMEQIEAVLGEFFSSPAISQ